MPADQPIATLANAFVTLTCLERDWLELLPHFDRRDHSPRVKQLLMLAVRKLLVDAKGAINEAAVALGTSFDIEDVYPEDEGGAEAKAEMN